MQGIEWRVAACEHAHRLSVNFTTARRHIGLIALPRNGLTLPTAPRGAERSTRGLIGYGQSDLGVRRSLFREECLPDANSFSRATQAARYEQVAL